MTLVITDDCSSALEAEVEKITGESLIKKNLDIW